MLTKQIQNRFVIYLTFSVQIVKEKNTKKTQKKPNE